MVPLKIELPKEFLNEEIRCEYKVSRQMKEVWAVELDLLAELLRVCKKYNIKIFASGGTLLGAIRHGGMIPWDDDIDMMMFRDDYEKLCEVAGKEFEHPYFFQTEYTDPGSMRGHAQLHNSNTTGMVKFDKEKGYTFNQGIFIDIFPLDNVIDDEMKFLEQGKLAEKFKLRASRIASISTRYSSNESENSAKKVVKKILFYTISPILRITHVEEKYYAKFDKACSMYNNKNTKRVSTLTFIFMNEQHIKYREDFDEIIYVPFEFLEIPIGKKYDHALQTRYGNYMQFDKNANCHGDIFFDTDKPYTFYL